jgi:hypothetical protein
MRYINGHNFTYAEECSTRHIGADIEVLDLSVASDEPAVRLLNNYSFMFMIVVSSGNDTKRL